MDLKHRRTQKAPAENKMSIGQMSDIFLAKQNFKPELLTKGLTL